MKKLIAIVAKEHIMKNNIQKNVVVNVDELTQLATYGGNDGRPPQPRGLVLSFVTKVATAAIVSAIDGYVDKKLSKSFKC